MVSGFRFPVSGLVSGIAVLTQLSILEFVLHTEPTGNRQPITGNRTTRRYQA
jgi:hypothetical protein